AVCAPPRHTDQDDDFEFNLAAPLYGSEQTQPARQPVVIVDDDGPTLRAIADSLTESGFDVHAMTRSEDTLIKVDELHRNGARPTVLLDLIMPKMDGSGVLGGLELLELLSNNFSDLKLIIMTDYHHAEAEKKIHELGCFFIVKPRRVEISDTIIFDEFTDRLVRNIHQNAAVQPGEGWQERYNLGDELRIEMGEEEESSTTGETAPQSSGLSLLRGMLEELNNPDLQGGVLLLVLRFASEFLNRAIAFTITDNIVSGSGQFGISGGAISGDERVRSIQFPLEADSMFQEAFRTGQAVTKIPAPTPLDLHVFEQLAGGTPEEYFIGPLVSGSRVIGFLYGDNLPDRRGVGDVDSLTIFLSQAGLAMERSILERQLHERVAT
ncbi:MAG TPA: response regulator, partial [Desulfuromonadales bacterium]|nr:response regulator [Desulfuromonadales bacterium]